MNEGIPISRYGGSQSEQSGLASGSWYGRRDRGRGVNHSDRGTRVERRNYRETDHPPASQLCSVNSSWARPADRSTNLRNGNG
ncbi:hypothetical protein J6590_019143 [Homalodisca vitripennis]|nr:hypothetical protein J6590_019143 [Homalodisca vitripennis]